MAYDGATRTVLFFGGHGEGPDTWTWDGTTKTWSPHQLAVEPLDRHGAGMAYDAISRKVLLFGGETCHPSCPGLGDTWTWDGITKTWSQRFPAAQPRPREFPYMAYHASTARVVLFGGSVNNDTWTWHGATGEWTQQHPITSPCHRQAGAMAYHAGTASAVIFGGDGSNCTVNMGDTWAWNGRNWKRKG